MTPILEAALCLVVLPILKRIGLALDVSGREAVARLFVARSHAYEVAGRLPARLGADEPAVAGAGDAEELRRLRIHVAVLEYRLANAGSWCPGERTVYNEALRTFVLDLAKRHGVATEMTQADFAAACGIPLPTLKDWWAQRRAQLDLFPSSATTTPTVDPAAAAEPSKDLPDLNHENSSPPAPMPADTSSSPTSPESASAPSIEEPVRISFSLEMCEIIRKYDAWHGTFDAFYQEQRRDGFRHGKT